MTPELPSSRSPCAPLCCRKPSPASCACDPVENCVAPWAKSNNKRSCSNNNNYSICLRGCKCDCAKCHAYAAIPSLPPDATICPHTFKAIKLGICVRVCAYSYICKSARVEKRNGKRNSQLSRCRAVAVAASVALSLAAITAIFHAFKFWFRLRKRFAIYHFASPRNKSRIDWPLFTRVGSASTSHLALASALPPPSPTSAATTR